MTDGLGLSCYVVPEIDRIHNKGRLQCYKSSDTET